MRTISGVVRKVDKSHAIIQLENGLKVRATLKSLTFKAKIGVKVRVSYDLTRREVKHLEKIGQTG